MRIANKLANFTMGQADILRKAMGKKRPEEMEKQKETFIRGAVANGISEKKAIKIFDLMAFFAEYGFNKSHSAAYAYVAYQTAYLKAHYPVEFMAATLSADMDNTDKIVKFIAGCREMGIEILPPDINLSGKEFKVVGNSIRFGLEAVKGVGSSAIESIIESRDAEGPFNSIINFLERVDQRKVNKKVVESLIKAGAFDSSGVTRAQAMESMSGILNGSSRNHAGKGLGQQSIFGDAPEESGGGLSEWSEEEMLKHEKEALGFYITGHPLTKYDKHLKTMGTNRISGLDEIADGQEVKIGGILTSIRKIQTKSKAEIMAYCTLEDSEANIEIIVFPDLYRSRMSILQKDTPLLVRGTLDKTEKGIKIVSTDICRLDADGIKTGHKVEIVLKLPLTDNLHLQALRSILPSDGRGEFPLYLRIFHKDTETLIATGLKMSQDTEIIDKLEKIAGKGAVVFQ
jgi:DNA polymerase-3 subunit alpha